MESAMRPPFFNARKGNAPLSIGCSDVAQGSLSGRQGRIMTFFLDISPKTSIVFNILDLLHTS